MSQKHGYKIVFGHAGESWQNVYEYSYRSTKGIRLSLVRGAAEIDACMAPLYDARSLVSAGNYLFLDAAKKACVLHLLHFSQVLPGVPSSILVDGERRCVSSGGGLDGLITTPELRRAVPHCAVSDGAVRRVLERKPSRQDSLDASLTAYLYAKSTEFEADRLVCLWMSMNGLYSAISRLVGRHVQKRYRREGKQIELFLRVNGLGGQFFGTQRASGYRKLIDDVLATLRLAPGGLRRVDLEEGPLADAVRDSIARCGEPYDITPYGYVLMAVGYHFRCRLFHGSRPLPLYAHRDESEIRCLRACNDLIEEFLDQNLFLWLGGSYYAEHLEQNVRAVAEQEAGGQVVLG